MLVGFVSARSVHDLTEWLRRRRGGPGVVEYVLSPDPNLGPFRALDPAQVAREAATVGLRFVARHGAQAVPQPDEIAFRARNFSPRGRSVARFAGWTLAKIEKLPGLRSRRGRFQFLLLER